MLSVISLMVSIVVLFYCKHIVVFLPFVSVSSFFGDESFCLEICILISLKLYAMHVMCNYAYCLSEMFSLVVRKRQ